MPSVSAGNRPRRVRTTFSAGPDHVCGGGGGGGTLWAVQYAQAQSGAHGSRQRRNSEQFTTPTVRLARHGPACPAPESQYAKHAVALVTPSSVLG